MRMQWNTYTPEASFQTVCNGEQYAAMVLQQGGPEALQQWRQLEKELQPLQQGASSFPAAALRSDVGTCWLASTSAMFHLLSPYARILALQQGRQVRQRCSREPSRLYFSRSCLV